jgi:hypothetical protein
VLSSFLFLTAVNSHAEHAAKVDDARRGTVLRPRFAATRDGRNDETRR